VSLRVRFAPSPTGALHIGGARTALYNWLLARGGGGTGETGTLVLRIEDTDRERSTPENVDQILDALEWLGIGWDEGPVFQSERAERHREMLDRLLESGHAYRSNATGDDVKAYKAEHGQDRGFRGEPEDTGAIRLHVPDEGESVVRDVVRGDTNFAHVHLDDPVIARADGSVLYNFAVAIDDMDAEISHVVRGEDHLSNTPKQLLVLEALGVEPPVYAHLPLLHGPDGKKLSKRHGAASVQELRAAGYLPEAVDNYVALLGAGFDPDREIFTLDELAQRFRLDHISRNPAIFDERKLRNFNGIYVRELGLDELTRRLEAFTGHPGLGDAALISREKIGTLADFWPLSGFLFDGPVDDPKAREKILGRDGALQHLEDARAAIASVEPWTVEGVEAALQKLVEPEDVKPRDVFQPVRVAIAGTTVSPGIWESVALLGRDEALRRIDAALQAAQRMF
jgi:glutamyl-tRNA synthetase